MNHKKTRKRGRQMKKIGEKGITMVALIITIIVLIILAGVTIPSLTDKKGVINSAKEAKQDTESQTAKEMLQEEVLKSDDRFGGISLDKLKKNIKNDIKGATIQNESTTTFPLNVKIEEYSFTIDEEGNVTEQ